MRIPSPTSALDGGASSTAVARMASTGSLSDIALPFWRRLRRMHAVSAGSTTLVCLVRAAPLMRLKGVRMLRMRSMPRSGGAG